MVNKFNVNDKCIVNRKQHLSKRALGQKSPLWNDKNNLKPNQSKRKLQKANKQKHFILGEIKFGVYIIQRTNQIDTIMEIELH